MRDKPRNKKYKEKLVIRKENIKNKVALVQTTLNAVMAEESILLMPTTAPTMEDQNQHVEQ